MFLSYDVTRCEGEGCGMRGLCKRHIDLILPLVGGDSTYLGVSRCLCDCDAEEREHFIPAEEVL